MGVCGRRNLRPQPTPQHLFDPRRLSGAANRSDGVNNVDLNADRDQCRRRPHGDDLVPRPTACSSRPGTLLPYSGDGNDPDDGRLPDSAFTWNIDFLHEGHVHPGMPVTGVRSGSFTIRPRARLQRQHPLPDHPHGPVIPPDWAATKSVIVQPRKVNLSFDSVRAAAPSTSTESPRRRRDYEILVGFNHNDPARTKSPATRHTRSPPGPTVAGSSTLSRCRRHPRAIRRPSTPARTTGLRRRLELQPGRGRTAT